MSCVINFDVPKFHFACRHVCTWWLDTWTHLKVKVVAKTQREYQTDRLKAERHPQVRTQPSNWMPVNFYHLLKYPATGCQKKILRRLYILFYFANVTPGPEAESRFRLGWPPTFTSLCFACHHENWKEVLNFANFDRFFSFKILLLAEKRVLGSPLDSLAIISHEVEILRSEKK